MEEKRKLFHEILDLVLDINGFEKRDKNTTGDKPTVFLDIYGHTADIAVLIHDNGWVPDADPDFRGMAYFDRSSDGLKNLASELKRKKEELNV